MKHSTDQVIPEDQVTHHAQEDPWGQGTQEILWHQRYQVIPADQGNQDYQVHLWIQANHPVQVVQTNLQVANSLYKISATSHMGLFEM